MEVPILRDVVPNPQRRFEPQIVNPDLPIHIRSYICSYPVILTQLLIFFTTSRIRTQKQYSAASVTYYMFFNV